MAPVTALAEAPVPQAPHRLHAVEVSLRERLLDRRERLLAVQDRDREARCSGDGAHRLLAEVDAALARMEAGTFGVCEVCGDSVEAERLTADPLLRFCLDHLSRRERRALQHDLDTAARIQAALQPAADLAVAGWETRYEHRPAGPVGGDFCILLPPETPGAPLCFAFGDAAGKGVSGSLLVSHLHAVLRGLLAAGLPLAETVTRANRLFAEHTPANSYATAVIGCLGADGTAHLVNAGHPPVLLRGADGSVRSLPASGLPLGLFPDGDFRAETVPMAADDALVLFTDGISEAVGEEGEEYGVDRLAALLSRLDATGSGRRLAAACLADVAAFRAAGAATTAVDDVALLVVRRTGG